MTVDSWSKLIVCVMVLVSATLLGIEKIINSEALVALISAVLGYVFGNGHGIMSAQKLNQNNGSGIKNE